MRNKFLAGIVGAVVISTLGAVTAMAATAGWIQQGSNWYYQDRYGEAVTSQWQKSGDGWYYLGDEGAMLTDQIVDDGNNLYYVDENGRMATNTWKKIQTENDDSERWYYFQSSGKAARATGANTKTLTINGKKYAFDSDGRMLYGFVNEDGSMIDQDEDVLGGYYYYGGEDDGALKTGWVQIQDNTNDTYADYESIWVYFNTTNGKKVTSATKTINGNKYEFDENGVMISGWSVTTASGSTTSSAKYYSASSDGRLQKNAWIHAVPGNDVDSTDYEEGNYRWFYTNNSGEVIKDTTKKIKGKTYVFDSVGRMKSGLVVLNQDSTSGAQIEETLDKDSITAKDIYNGNYGLKLRYFSGDEANDGSMKTGIVKIELSDGEYTFVFGSAGTPNHGIKNGKLYVSGLLVQADPDYKYQAIENPIDNQYYVVGTNGTVVKSGKTVKDADGNYFAVYNSKIAYIRGDNASKAASSFAKTGDVGSYSDIRVTYYN